MSDQQDEQDLAGLLDALPERIARLRASDLTVLYCNTAKAAEYGLSPAELVGRPLSDVLTAGDFQAVRDHLAGLSPDVPVLRQVNPLRREGAPTRWIEWVERWHPGRGTGAEVLSVGRDITEAYRRELAQLEVDSWFRIAMADAPIGMAIVDPDHRLLQVNDALCRFLGRTEEELLKRTTLDVTHPDDIDADLAYGHGPLGDSRPEGLEKRYLRPDGSVVWGLLKVSPVHDSDGDVRYVIGQVVDITDRVAREQQLRRTAEAEHHIANQLRDLDRVKNTFLTAVSHELRTPLTVVRGMAATLRRLGDTLDGDTRASLEVALERHAEQLSHLLDELLDVDRLARGTYRTSQEELELVGLVAEVVAASPGAHRTRVQASGELRATADPVQVRRIVSNLLDNVEKYAPQGGVEVRLRQVGRGGFRIEVLDEGPGIAEEDRGRIFEAFHRGDPEHPRPGTGVGLALVAEFARLHHGSAWAEPATSGAHLVVEVPARSA